MKKIPKPEYYSSWKISDIYRWAKEGDKKFKAVKRECIAYKKLLQCFWKHNDQDLGYLIRIIHTNKIQLLEFIQKLENPSLQLTLKDDGSRGLCRTKTAILTDNKSNEKFIIYNFKLDELGGMY
jgi:hypothetical protein